jgi:hypothetical protein
MSCWVVPTVAAELWGVPVEAILDRARTGLVPSKTENGFMFVDVAPDSTKCDPPKGIRPPSPPTYMIVSEPELGALRADEDAAQPTQPMMRLAQQDELEIPAAPAPTLDDWRAGRKLASRTRRPPQFG